MMKSIITRSLLNINTINNLRIRFYGDKTGHIFISKKSYDCFRSSISRILSTVLSDRHIFEQQNTDHVKKLMEYNVLEGRKLTVLLLLHAYETFEKPKKITDESLEKACVLAWCNEIYNTSLLMADDVIDRGEKRRDKICWYLLPDVGFKAIIDTYILVGLTYHILDIYFSGQSNYANILEHFNKAMFFQNMGQHLDVKSDFKNIDVNNFTMDQFNTIAKYKTAYNFQLPLVLATILSNKYSKEACKILNNICADIGKLYQMQNDYLDCYGKSELTGKGEGNTDIPGGKCTWLAVKAFKLCNKEQRTEFIKCYGNSTPEYIKRIQDLYEQLHIPDLYAEEESFLGNSIKQKACSFPAEISPEPINNLIDVIIGKRYLKYTTVKS